MPCTTTLAGLALAALLAASPALAAPPSDFDGDWAGALSAGGQTLHLVLHVKSDAQGSSAILDSVDQQTTSPATAVKIEDRKISVLFLSIGGELTGTLSPEKTDIVGNWNQGATLPLTLTKKAAK